MRGRSHFNQIWVQMPSLKGDWGLGPTLLLINVHHVMLKVVKGFYHPTEMNS